MNAGFINKKKEKAKNLKKLFGIQQKYSPLGLIKINNKELLKDLRDAFLNIQAGFIIEVEGIEIENLGPNIVAVGKIDEIDLIGFDFLICDDDIEKIDIYTKNGIVPLIRKDNKLSKILMQFNPMKNEGNAFFYDDNNKWSIFAVIIKYMENYKFPFDNKCLVKNVLEV